jgi:hypothetical protein
VHESLAGLYGRLLLNLRGAKAILYNGQSPFRFVPRLEMVDLSARKVDLAENSTSSVKHISSACNAILYRTLLNTREAPVSLHQATKTFGLSISISLQCPRLNSVLGKLLGYKTTNRNL